MILAVHVSTVLTLALAVPAGIRCDVSADRPRIGFVCEHRTAKSVIAAAYFNKLAMERGLGDRAVYRGASPQADLSIATVKGLRKDGLTVSASKPGPIALTMSPAPHTSSRSGAVSRPTPPRAARRTAGTTCQR